MPKTDIPLINKIFLILETLAGESVALAIHQIAERTGIPRPTVHRLLNQMEELGYVGCDHRVNCWFPGLRLAQLQPRGDFAALKQAALPKMQFLHKTFDETVNLGVLTGGRIYYLMSLETTKALRWVVRPHQTDNFYSTALGLSIVSHLPAVERDALLAHTDLKQQTEKTFTDMAELKTLLQRVRRKGWAQEEGQNEEGVVCLGVPLLNDGYPLGAISISIPEFRMTKAMEKPIVNALLSISNLEV
ncbi:MAG: IclR family transcriptional regulator [Puniceicoccales bacterium]